MSLRIFSAATLLAIAALVASGPSADAGVERQVVRGRMLPAVQDSASHGRFRMVVADRTNGAHVERIEAFARRLDVSAATEFHVFLVKSDGSDAADFGAMRVNQYGNGFLLFDTRAEELPSPVATISDYGGGTIEVRSGATAVLSGEIPAFGGGSPGSAVFGHDRQVLRPTALFGGRGVILARRQEVALDVRESVRVVCGRLENGATYDVVVVAEDSSETELGTFTTSDPLGLGGFRLSTAHGDTIGGGGVLGLAGQRVEVRDASANVVLEGTFPSIE